MRDECKESSMGERSMEFMLKLVDYLEKCLIYGHIRRFAD